jgi:hypothetical protein
MSLLADALQPFIVRELVAIAGRIDHMALPDIIVDPTAAYDLDFDNTVQSILMDFRTPDFITPVLAADCCRLSSASFQSVASIQQEILQRDNVAWSMVKLYYSAFYAGHTLIRMFGEACSYFDRQHVVRLNVLAGALGRAPTFNIESGVYRCILDANHAALNCTKARRASGGAHETFWDIFGNRMRIVADGILQGAMVRTEAQAAFSQIDDFRQILNRRSGYAWLSGIRNDLQYRHHFGVWFPAQLNMRERQVLSGFVGDWKRDPMEIDLQSGRSGILGEFVTCCVFIIALCHTMLKRLGDRSSAGTRSFVWLGPMAFLNDIQARAAEQA